MKSKITKLAAAAVIIIAVTFGLTTVLNKSVSTAYALEQTIQASHTVRYLHTKDFPPGEDEPKECWIEFDEQGNVKNARGHIPEWDSPEDGAKEAIWLQGKATVWLKKKNVLFTITDKLVAQKLLEMAQEFDPKLAVERLREKEKSGRVKIETKETTDKTEPIIVTATYLPGSSSPDKREVLFVDQATKLVTAIEFYELKDGEYQQKSRMEFSDYNQQIDTEMFTLANLPSDIMRVDQTTQEVGLVQGNLSNTEIAAEVVRQFFEALIARDYNKAGRLYEGIPGERLQQALGKVKFVRIISVGPVGPHPFPATGGVIVPCVVEVEENGKITEAKFDKIGVRQVYNQPGRWTIFGGI